MLINLSDVLSEHHKTIDKTTSVEMTEFHSELGRFPVLEKEDVHIVVKHVKNRELMITGEGRLVLEIMSLALVAAARNISIVVCKRNRQ